MGAAKCDDEEFIAMFRAYGAEGVANRYNVTLTGVYKRRRRIERRLGITVRPPTKADETHSPERYHIDVTDGTVIVGSDAHYWPNYIPTAHRALLWACKRLKPKAVIMNGDILDAPTISRHAPPSINWDYQPKFADELACAQERMTEIAKAAKNAELIWPLGNHDARMELRIAADIPELGGLYGTSLKDHFPEWHPCFSAWVNRDVVVKHRFRGGIHATHNNVLWAGKTIVTGHLHSQKVTPLTDYNGTRWGVDAGCIADPFGPQFLYCEDSPRNWRSGFCVLTFENGVLLPPELVTVWEDGVIVFRGSTVVV